MKECVAVSACLLGIKTKYDGGDNNREEVWKMIKGKTVLLICPEVFSGMSTPRNPSEIKGNKVISDKMEDVTFLFEKGAAETLDFLQRNNCKKAILKDGSPSCGSALIDDGTFTHHKIPGKGITAKILVENGIEVVTIK